MTHVKHLRVETETELEALETALGQYIAATAYDTELHQAAEILRSRLQAAPVARNGGLVHVEDATYATSAPEALQ